MIALVAAAMLVAMAVPAFAQNLVPGGFDLRIPIAANAADLEQCQNEIDVDQTNNQTSNQLRFLDVNVIAGDHNAVDQSQNSEQNAANVATFDDVNQVNALCFQILQQDALANAGDLFGPERKGPGNGPPPPPPPPE